MSAASEPKRHPPDAPEPSDSDAQLGERLIAGFLPGLLAGSLLTGLIFFLNVDLPFEFGPLARGVALYGGLLGLVSTTLSYILLPKDPAASWRSLPWALALVLAAVAILSAYHASRYSLYLPPGINVRLIKAAIWLSIGALIYFYTALLHSLHNRRYGIRSRVGLLLVAIAAVYVMGERRDAFDPPPPPTPLPASIAIDARPQLWVIGIEGATLDAILPLAEQGLLPTFARLLEEGAHARLSSFKPVEPVAHWTTLVTGKLPYQHGVLAGHLHSAEFLEDGATLELTPGGSHFSWPTLGPELPLPKRERQSPNLWEIFDRLGLVTGTAGWPVSQPSPAGAAFGFATQYFDGFPDAASPTEFAERGLMFRPTELALDALIEDVFDGGDSSALRRGLEADEWRLGLMAFLSDQKRGVDAHFVLLPGLAAVSQEYFGGFDAVQFRGSTRERYQHAFDVVVSYYQFLDTQIGLLLSRAEPSRLVTVVSPFGYAPPQRIARVWSELTGAQLQGTTRDAPDGVLLLSGDGVRPDHFLETADMIDLVPTLLYGLGLPVARDLEGRVLTAAFENAFLAGNPLTFVPSYERVAREGEFRLLLDDELSP